MLKVEIYETILHAISIRIDPVFSVLGSPVRTVRMGKPNIQNWRSSHWEVMSKPLRGSPLGLVDMCQDRTSHLVDI